MDWYWDLELYKLEYMLGCRGHIKQAEQHNFETPQPFDNYIAWNLGKKQLKPDW